MTPHDSTSFDFPPFLVKNHTAPFTLDNRSLLQQFRPAFELFYEFDLEKSGISPEEGLPERKKEFEQWFEGIARFMKEEYGLEF